MNTTTPASNDLPPQTATASATAGSETPTGDAPVADAPAADAPQVNLVGTPAPVASTDSSQLDPADFPPRQFPVNLPRRNEFQAVVRRSVLNEIHRHGQSNLDVEICGVVVGNVFRDDAGVFLVIDGSIRGNNAASRNAQVTFTPETWTGIQAEMEANHPNRRIVGWYHTHPGFGIFLSDMDHFVQSNFFNLAWQVAIVYDPKSAEEGLFVWKAGKTERVPMLVEEDVEKEIAAPPATIVTPELVGELAYQMTCLQKRVKQVMVLMAVVLLLALAWPFVLYTAMSGGNWRTIAPAHNPPAQVAAPREPVATPAPSQIEPSFIGGTAQPAAGLTRPDETVMPVVPATQRTTQPTGVPVPPVVVPAATPEVVPPATVPAVPVQSPAAEPQAVQALPQIIRPTASRSSGSPSGPRIIDVKP